MHEQCSFPSFNHAIGSRRSGFPHFPTNSSFVRRKPDNSLDIDIFFSTWREFDVGTNNRKQILRGFFLRDAQDRSQQAPPVDPFTGRHVEFWSSRPPTMAADNARQITAVLVKIYPPLRPSVVWFPPRCNRDPASTGSAHRVTANCSCIFGYR